MPNNHEEINTEQTSNHQKSNEIQTEQRQTKQQLGARVLSQAHFESNHPIVESSFNKDMNRGENSLVKIMSVGILAI